MPLGLGESIGVGIAHSEKSRIQKKLVAEKVGMVASDLYSAATGIHSDSYDPP